MSLETLILFESYVAYSHIIERTFLLLAGLWCCLVEQGIFIVAIRKVGLFCSSWGLVVPEKKKNYSFTGFPFLFLKEWLQLLLVYLDSESPSWSGFTSVASVARSLLLTIKLPAKHSLCYFFVGGSLLKISLKDLTLSWSFWESLRQCLIPCVGGDSGLLNFEWETWVKGLGGLCSNGVRACLAGATLATVT